MKRLLFLGLGLLSAVPVLSMDAPVEQFWAGSVANLNRLAIERQNIGRGQAANDLRSRMEGLINVLRAEYANKFTYQSQINQFLGENLYLVKEPDTEKAFAKLKKKAKSWTRHLFRIGVPLVGAAAIFALNHPDLASGLYDMARNNPGELASYTRDVVAPTLSVRSQGLLQAFLGDVQALAGVGREAGSGILSTVKGFGSSVQSWWQGGQ